MTDAVLPRYYHSLTDVGREREANEDAHAEYALGDGSILLVVADGMGGHECGEVASRIAVEAIGQIVNNSPADDPREKLRNGFLVANQRILTEAERSGAQGMGTTAVAVYVRGDQVYVAHVGDSRLYHIRAGAIAAKTVDHTRVQKMVEKGVLSSEEAKKHPDANVVTRALGHARLVDGSALEPEVRAEPISLASGDSLVLCTDGLYDDVEDGEIAAALAGGTASSAAQALVDLANARGGHDNITVTVLHYGADRGVPLPERGPRRITAEDAPAPRTPRRSALWAVIGSAGALLLVLPVVMLVRGGWGKGSLGGPGPAVATGHSPQRGPADGSAADGGHAAGAPARARPGPSTEKPAPRSENPKKPEKPAQVQGSRPKAGPPAPAKKEPAGKSDKKKEKG